MARKSRKNVDSAPQQAKSKPILKTGAYIRLSAVDRKQKGDSIETQQAIIAAFIAEHPELELAETYIDNGLSGQSFDRPAFRRMVEDIEDGRIVCCVTKDLSRLGRNAIDAGYYIEQYFPTHGVRFIAITDDYDSAVSQNGNIMVTLKNMVNEAYAMDIGRKIRATKQMNIRNGCFVGKYAPYGYLKSAADNHKLVIDELAAPVVRRIFEMAADGQGVTAITRWLNDDAILPPKRHLLSIGVLSEKDASGHIHWNKTGIYAILRNQMYCGDMVQGKGKTHSYVFERVPASEWIITENTHEAIVSRELFDTVQQLWKKPDEPRQSPYKEPATENIFLRKIFCAHCGYALRRARTSETKYRFKCDTRMYYTQDDCRPVSINENTLKEMLLAMLRKQEAVIVAPHTPMAHDVDSAGKEEWASVKADLEKNSRFLQGLYESLILGDIQVGEYKDMKAAYETRIASLVEKEKRLRQEARDRHVKAARLSKASEHMQAVQAFSDLSADMVDTFVEKILIYDDARIGVKFRFLDEIAFSWEGADDE